MENTKDEPMVLDYDATSDSFRALNDRPVCDMRRRGGEFVIRSASLVKRVGKQAAEQTAWRILQITILGAMAVIVYGVVKLVIWLATRF